MSCPCGKGESIETCCGPLLKGERAAKTAEELMRSRYTAYATGNIDYVIETHDPDKRGDVDRSSTETWSQQSKWLGLEIKRAEGGGESDPVGEVEFVARYKIKNMTISHHELASFRTHNGRWYFVDGKEISSPPIKNDTPKIGRNDPCSCGSGKKYKKCHGATAA